MAKKLGKFLLFSAAVGAAATGVYYYMQNKNNASLDDLEEFDDSDDDDFDDDDFDYDFDEDNKRSYVSLDLSGKDSQMEKAAETLENTVGTAKEKAAEVTSKISQAATETVEKVEEFFDEEDDSHEGLDSI